MLITYEFYVADSEGAELRFVPVLCESERELVSRARELMAETKAGFVEVRRAGEVLFRLVG